MRHFSRFSSLFVCALVLVACGTYQKTDPLGSFVLRAQNVLERGDTYLETKRWRVVLKENQKLPGASKIRLKRACGAHACITDEEWKEYRHILVALGAVTRDAFGSVMFNQACLMNHAYQIDPPIPLFHCHFYPRYEKDMTVVVNGQVFSDVLFGRKDNELFEHHYADRESAPRAIRQETRKEILRVMRHGVRRYLDRAR